MLLLYRNNAIGAHSRAKGAGDTFALVGYADRVMPLFVDYVLGKLDDFFGARVHAQAAALA